MSEQIDLNRLKIDQLGYVYKDIKKQAELMEDIFRIPKFTFLPPISQIVKNRGKDSEITSKLAISRMLNVQIELIQLIEGDCIYREFLDQGKEGLQHISMFFEDLNDMEPYIRYFNSKGYEIVHSGNIGKRYYYYFDTTDVLGYMIEIQATKIRKKRNEP